jgi:hypothetical protein
LPSPKHYLKAGLCTRIFQVLKCRSLDGVGSVLNADYGVGCYTVGGNHEAMVGVAALFMVLYVVGVPLGVYLLLHFNRKHLHDQASRKYQQVSREFGTLYEQYEPAYWFYECFVLVKKMLLTGAMCVVAAGSSVQLLIAILIVLFFMLCVFKMGPFVDDVDDWLSFLTAMQRKCCVCVCVLLLGALRFVFYARCLTHVPCPRTAFVSLSLSPRPPSDHQSCSRCSRALP